MLSLVVAYFAGVLSTFIIEVWVLLFIIGRLLRHGPSKSNSTSRKQDLMVNSSDVSLPDKQGTIWVAITCLSEPYKDTKGFHTQQIKGSKEAKAKKDSLKEISELSPVQKHAKIKDHVLILTDLDGSKEVIELAGCHVTAVSGGAQSSGKWARRYPIKLENKNSVLAFGSKVCLIYLETAWEKEAWCKALRLASRTGGGGSGPGGADWYWMLKKEFEQYFIWLNEGYPLLLKSNFVVSNQRDRNDKDDATSSKVRLFLKKLARKSTKTGNEGKINNFPAANQEEKKIGSEALINPNSSSLTDFSRKASLSTKNRDDHLNAESSPSSASRSFGNQSKLSGASHIDSENSAIVDSDVVCERGIIDQGTLCWNLLFSRFFFDFKKSSEAIALCQVLIQRLLSKVRTRSYISGIACTRVDVGKLPPHICNMRVLPVTKDEAWALEADIEYSGGAIIDIETRLNISEAAFQERLTTTGLESEIAGEVTSGLLNKDFEGLGEQLGMVRDVAVKKDRGEISDGAKTSNIPGWRSNLPSLKGMLSHLAGQVSQVPLALSIRVLSLKGTLRISVKPPPSDRIWFGFTSTPSIEWGFEPSIGDRKINFSTIAEFIASRIEAAIRENLVLPNCGDIYIPWMQAEKDDWVPNTVAPVPWLHQESSESMGYDNSIKRCCESFKTKAAGHSFSEDTKSSADKLPKGDANNSKNVPSVASQLAPGADAGVIENHEQPKCPRELSSRHTRTRSLNYSRSDDSLTPLSDNDLQYDEGLEVQTNVLDRFVSDDQSFSLTDEKPKRGRRSKMLGLSKKMGEKLEEKKRHIEEKSRHIVEKMRGVEKNEGVGSES